MLMCAACAAYEYGGLGGVERGRNHEGGVVSDVKLGGWVYVYVESSGWTMRMWRFGAGVGPRTGVGGGVSMILGAGKGTVVHSGIEAGIGAMSSVMFEL
jgi:hypothetical protein